MSHNQNHFEADFRFLQDIIHSQIEREKRIFHLLFIPQSFQSASSSLLEWFRVS